jgi:hypothetical protein
MNQIICWFRVITPLISGTSRPGLPATGWERHRKASASREEIEESSSTIRMEISDFIRISWILLITEYRIGNILSKLILAQIKAKSS